MMKMNQNCSRSLTKRALPKLCFFLLLEMKNTEKDGHLFAINVAPPSGQLAPLAVLVLLVGGGVMRR